ncbi:MAG TPA: prepilin-type N-terminal cleavage/methylation domain-containing protein [Bryobacteraceae bacterium]|nr:prepilin-type N-terminal cleavage/methylation domain-containing protein [Bryobacteraceae bacterium]
MRRGFTLLELLVATLIMGIAVAGLLSNMSVSLRNAARLTEHDRASVLARAKMDELLLDRTLPAGAEVQGRFAPEVAGGVEAGWRASVSLFEAPPNAHPGMSVLERVALEIWWRDGGSQRSYKLDGYRRGQIPVQAAPQ